MAPPPPPVIEPVPPPPPGAPITGPPDAEVSSAVGGPSVEPPPGAAPPPSEPRRSGLAVAALVCGIAGLVLCFLIVPGIAAIVLGLVAARQVRRSRGSLTGLGMARAGVATGVVGVILGAVFLVVAFSGVLDSGERAVFDLDIGDCVDVDLDPAGGAVDTLPVKECDEPHDGEVFATGELNPSGDRTYPGAAALFAEIDQICSPDAVAAYVGDENAAERFVVYPIGPNEEAWNGLAGRYTCIAIAADGRPLIDPLGAP